MSTRPFSLSSLTSSSLKIKKKSKRKEIYYTHRGTYEFKERAGLLWTSEDLDLLDCDQESSVSLQDNLRDTVVDPKENMYCNIILLIVTVTTGIALTVPCQNRYPDYDPL